MEVLGIIVLVIYGLLLTFILLYSFIQFGLLLKYWKKKPIVNIEFLSDEDKPKVTVQLPIYNEKYVAERLIDCISSFNYPKDKLEIQVLDDSTDETVDIINAKVDQISSKGIDIKHIRREYRDGFKAGALAYGTSFAKGDFIVIFDSDFLPDAEFLIQTLPYFNNENIGVVQTKWKHLNKDFSILTQLQAFGLDAHFSVEQKGRNDGGHFINFNGTAGVWRKSTIIDAGGWQSDTLTEDLDLSYRAQLQGWNFIYLEHVGAPAELPVSMNALKTQQYRWTKGAAECARKNLYKVLINNKINFKTKVNAIFHLMNSFLFVCILLLALLSVPLLHIKTNFTELNLVFNLGIIYFLSLIILIAFYWTSEKNESEKGKVNFFKFCLKFLLFLSFSMGLSLHNAIAVIEGYIGRKSPFIRTPKFNIHQNKINWKSNEYVKKAFQPITLLEGLLAIYALFGIVEGVKIYDFSLIPFHVMLFIGFGSIFFYSLNHSFSINKE